MNTEADSPHIVPDEVTLETHAPAMPGASVFLSVRPECPFQMRSIEAADDETAGAFELVGLRFGYMQQAILGGPLPIVREPFNLAMLEVCDAGRDLTVEIRNRDAAARPGRVTIYEAGLTRGLRIGGIDDDDDEQPLRPPEAEALHRAGAL